MSIYKLGDRLRFIVGLISFLMNLSYCKFSSNSQTVNIHILKHITYIMSIIQSIIPESTEQVEMVDICLLGSNLDI